MGGGSAPQISAEALHRLGLNSADHAEESGAADSHRAGAVLRGAGCIVRPDDDATQPKGSTRLDWEVELGIVIGAPARHVGEQDAHKHIAGFCLANDISERGVQIERGGPWIKGRESFGPLGPFLAAPDEVGDVPALSMWREVNGERRQRGSPATMMFGVDVLVSYVSRLMVLDVGDVIITGTPPGVGLGMTPPGVGHKPGAVMTLGIDRLGLKPGNAAPFPG